MSVWSNKAIVSLLNMTRGMMNKHIEISRITKTVALLLMSGLSVRDVDPKIVRTCLDSQKIDGGFIGNSDTIWNIKLLEYYPEYCEQRRRALDWLKHGNGSEPGYGRSKRDMHRIPVTGLALYLLPELADDATCAWLEHIWLTEKNSLTYKAAYTLLAFRKNNYLPRHNTLIDDAVAWLVSQQQDSGGFSPWRDHPVGENVYCTALATLALIAQEEESLNQSIIKAYDYLCSTQLSSGIWAYHEIEDGASWGLLALTDCEMYLR